MLKTLLVSAVLTSTPVCFVLTMPQDRGSTPVPAPAAAQGDEVPRLRAELERARAELRAARAELEECLDLLEASSRPQRRNCTPSRASISHLQWLQDRGHGARAQRMVERIAEEHGNAPSRLNQVAWELMTDEATAGRLDRAALALVQRMLSAGEQPHRHLDTAALAHFLNGQVDEAVRLQRAALAQHGHGDDYRRRLRTYVAAQRMVAPAVAKTE